MPPEGTDVIVEYCPLSMTAFDAVGVPAASAASTVITALDDDAATPLWSVTVSYRLYVPAVANVNEFPTCVTPEVGE